MPSYYDSTKTKPGKAILKYKEGGKAKRKRKGASLGKLSDRQLALLREDILKPTKARAAFKAAGGGKVKKMAHGGKITVVGVENGHDVTLARGSGAARSQKFRKNG